MLVGHTFFGTGKEKVIVLHGWLSDQTVFQPMMHCLDPNSFTYIFVDCRGYGKSRYMAGKYNIAEIAADVIYLSNHLGWDKFHLVGHSTGAKAVQRIMVDAPERIKTATLITPVPASGLDLGDSWKIFESAATDAESRSTIMGYTSANRLSYAWINFMVRRSFETIAEEAMSSYLRSWAKEDFSDQLAGTKIPSLVLMGQHDPVIDPHLVSKTLVGWCKNITLAVLYNAGHYPMQETPVYLASVMERFMRDHVNTTAFLEHRSEAIATPGKGQLVFR